MAANILQRNRLLSAPWLQSLRKIGARPGEALELLLPRGWPESHGVIRWRLGGRPGAAPHGQVTDLNEIPGVGAMTRVQVWTPPADSLLTRVSLPTRSRAKIQQALPFALEDQLVGEPDQLHFAYRILENNALGVAVTARDRMQAWIAQLTAAGLRPSVLCPALLALPLETGSWSVTFHEKEMWVRNGINSGFTCLASLDTPPAMLQLALREAREKDDSPLNLTVFQPPAGLNVEIWSSQLKLPLNIRQDHFWDNYSGEAPPLNLLQGSYAPSHQIQKLLPALRPAAIMLALWIAGTLGFNSWEWWHLKSTHDDLRAEMTKVFRQTFPDAQVVVDPALQMQRLLADLTGKSGKSTQADALPLMSQLAPVMQAHAQVKLRGIQYGESRLTVDISLPDFQTMETVKNAFIGRGLQVEIIGANSTASGIEGRLRLGQGAKAGT